MSGVVLLKKKKYSGKKTERASLIYTNIQADATKMLWPQVINDFFMLQL